MIDGWLFVLTLVAALGCGLIAGVFFAFSTFVMKALARLPAADGLAAMQAINLEAPTAWFMTGLFGTAAACVVVAVSGLFRLDEADAVYLITGSLLYIVGTIGLTIAYHVPRNNALAVVDPSAPDAASHWTRYAATWTAWNHVRAAAALAGAALLTVALRVS